MACLFYLMNVIVTPYRQVPSIPIRKHYSAVEPHRHKICYKNPKSTKLIVKSLVVSDG